MVGCASPSALSCLPFQSGSYALQGCYPSTPLVNGVTLTGNFGSAAQCITACSVADLTYVYASIVGGSCSCGDSSSAPTVSPSAPAMCNLLCSSGDNSLCGGYDGSSAYSGVYYYTSGGTSSCATLPGSTTTTTTVTTSTATPTTLQTSTVSVTSSIPLPFGTGCDFVVNAQFESGTLGPWTANMPEQISVVSAPVPGYPGVTPFAPSSYVLQALLQPNQQLVIQQTIAVCPLGSYDPKMAFQLAVDPAGGKKNAFLCTQQFCELTSGTCGRVASMRAGKWGYNSPAFKTKAGQTTAVIQVKFTCPGPDPVTAYLGSFRMNPK